MDVRQLAARQMDLVAAWQLMEAGFNRRAIEHRARQWGWRRVHNGVYALTSSPLTRHQRWMAAALTAPDTVLSHASAAACWGVRPHERSWETVTQPGNGGPRRAKGVLVLRSRTLDGDTTTRDGIRITTGARTLIDLAPHLNDRQLGRALREALRLNATSTQLLFRALDRHRGRRGTARVKELALRYEALPYSRTRSNAEARALELLDDAGIEAPQVNVRISGEEADLVWPDRRLIVEIDGPQFHRFAAEDARKQRLWERAGYTVRRIASNVVYDDPHRLIALARG